MPDATQPTATVAGQSIALHVTGYPDVPNRWGSGHIRVTGIRLDYGNSHTPNGRQVFVTGVWVRDDGQVTDNPVDRYYDAHDGDMSDWPDWIADLTRKHAPNEAQQDQAEAHPATTTWKVESPRRDKWASWGGTYDDDEYDWVRESYETSVKTAPGRPFRLVRATTTYTVEAEHTPKEA